MWEKALFWSWVLCETATHRVSALPSPTGLSQTKFIFSFLCCRSTDTHVLEGFCEVHFHYLNIVPVSLPPVSSKAERRVHSSGKSCVGIKRSPPQVQGDSKGVFPFWQWRECLFPVLDPHNPLEPHASTRAKPIVMRPKRSGISWLLSWVTLISHLIFKAEGTRISLLLSDSFTTKQ